MEPASCQRISQGHIIPAVSTLSVGGYHIFFLQFHHHSQYKTMIEFLGLSSAGKTASRVKKAEYLTGNIVHILIHSLQIPCKHSKAIKIVKIKEMPLEKVSGRE